MEQQWYAVGCTSPRKEMKVRDDARRYGLQSFVPLRYEVVRQKRTLVPAITGLIFIKGTLEELKEYLTKIPLPVYIRKSTFSNKQEYLIVPTKAMEDFIAVTENHEQHITYFSPDEIHLSPGDLIKIRGGIYDGREAVVMRIKGKRNKHLVVQIPGFLAAAIELSPSMVELKENKHPEKPSQNVEKDKQSLFQMAYRLLFEFPDKYVNENEYYLLQSEVRRAVQRLSAVRGYTPATETELALPLYLAVNALDAAEGTSVQQAVAGQSSAAEQLVAAEQRLRAAIVQLKATSLLKVKAQLYLGIVSKDEALLSDLRQIFALWRKSPLSDKQRFLIEEFNRLCKA